ncbi:MAG: CatB-related O-acetyltransferase [Candidatus Omnitrophica bacterium]|nr:CatB-related O-acetyltransferase [Candidatus Omnitrophota bacterium]
MWWSSIFNLTELQKRHPTCHFYSGAVVDANSSLGKYNIICENTKIIDSTVADYTNIQKNSCIISADIGRFCSIASRVSIGLGRHPTTYVSTHPAFYSLTQPLAKTFSERDRYNVFKRTCIGHDVWIGENAMIIDGIKIGTGAVIAAGAFVINSVPPYAVVVGAPATVMLYRFDKETRDALLETKWWERPEKWLQEHYKSFDNVDNFLKLF